MDEMPWPLAETLLGERPSEMTPVNGGANSRVYRIGDRSGQPFAFKVYPRLEHDRRDRLRAEFGALTFLRRQNISVVPDAIKADQAQRVALYQWIDGQPVTAPTVDDIDAALRFAGQLRDLGNRTGAQFLPPASEACLSPNDIVEQIERRLHRLADAPELIEFLDEPFGLALKRAVSTARAGYDRLGWDFASPLPSTAQVLSPSDFGFHNSLRRIDGSLVFLDFEYFGWDDPVKLVADFLQHPGMQLEAELSSRFAVGAKALYSGDPGFADRLNLLFPLIGLRWCLILLNEFVAERWKARQFAGTTEGRAFVLKRQLQKARQRLAAVTLTLSEHGL